LLQGPLPGADPAVGGPGGRLPLALGFSHLLFKMNEIRLVDFPENY